MERGGDILTTELFGKPYTDLIRCATLVVHYCKHMHILQLQLQSSRCLATVRDHDGNAVAWD